MAQTVVRTYAVPNQISTSVYAGVALSAYRALLKIPSAAVANGGIRSNATVVAALASHSFLAHWFPYRSYTFDLLIQAQLGNISARDLAVAKKIALPAARVRPPVLGLLMPQQLPLIRASPTLAAT